MKLPRRRFYRRKPTPPWLVVLQWIGIMLVGLTLFNMFASSGQPPEVQIPPTRTPAGVAEEHLTRADELFAGNAFSSAAAEYDTATHLDPTNMASWIAAARAHTYAREGELALEAANTAIVLDSKDPRPWAVRALALEWMNRYEEAQEDALRALDNDPNNPLALAVMAKVSTDLGNFDLANEMLARAYTHGPNEVETIRAAAYYAETVPVPGVGLPDRLEAIRLYESIIEQGVLLGWVYIRLGINYRLVGDLDSAIGSFRSAQQLYPDNVEPLAELGRMYTQLRDLETAREVLDEAAALDPSHRDVLGRLGILEYRSDNYDAAFFYLRCTVDGCDYPDRGISIEPAELNRFTVDYFSDYGLILTELGDCDRGLVILDNLVNFAPSDPDAVHVRNLGYEYCGQGSGGDSDENDDGGDS